VGGFEVCHGISRGPDVGYDLGVESAIGLPLAGEEKINQRCHHECGVEDEQ